MFKILVNNKLKTNKISHKFKVKKSVLSPSLIIESLIKINKFFQEVYFG